MCLAGADFRIIVENKCRIHGFSSSSGAKGPRAMLLKRFCRVIYGRRCRDVPVLYCSRDDGMAGRKDMIGKPECIPLD